MLLSTLVSIAAAAFAQPPEHPTGQHPGHELSPAERARRAKVVAKVDAVEITVGDVEDSINQQQAFLRARYREPARVRELVDTMVRFELLAAEAQRRGLGDDAQVVQTRKQNAVQRMLRLDFEERITADSVPAADVQHYYDTHEDEFHRPAMVRASHILVATREEATRLIATLSTEDARAFRESALQTSLDTETKLRGGDLRYFTRDGHPSAATDPAVDSRIAEAAFAITEVGGVSPEPVAVGDQWSVIKLTGRRPEEHRTFAEAESAIRMRLFREQRQNAIDAFLDQLRQRYHPVIHEEAMEPIRPRASGPHAPRRGRGGRGRGRSGPGPPQHRTRDDRVGFSLTDAGDR